MKLCSLLAFALLPSLAFAKEHVATDTSSTVRSFQVGARLAHQSDASVVDVCRAFVSAQLRYVQADRDGDGIREYAQYFISNDGKRDGLFYPASGVGDPNPLWPLLEKAQPHGYFAGFIRSSQPYHGYYYKILTKQGAQARGGMRDYMVGQHLIGGFALIAWPASYGEAGRDTYMVNQSGRILRKDLGPETAKLAKKITSYEPDAGWIVDARRP